MKLRRVGLMAALVAGIGLGCSGLLWAGGTGFGDDDDNTEDEGPSYFGFVRDVNGVSVRDAKVTAELKDRGALVTRTDIMGVYKIPGFGKEVNPDEVQITCAKDGYKQARTLRRPRPSDDNKAPIEVECFLQRN
jgi:hypothetical protein